ncbi:MULTISPECIES: sigma 54-interacting transcriptional regulator [Pelosinus]|uniref:HTH-type transcriptional regulatory protein TyrR n=2 Tax=Pelosinus TaxID=365348 RepID=I9DAZ9_9FIRM|nr:MULTISPECIES: sigma 54-interacting transcriptional regulator [Pelosinus]AJQ28963.1 putative sigma54 specific transcriptional regulator with PAS/PAC sensor [Pelosinus fermentans JBW45]MCC5467741.1 sigma 54-interacting transcriptional regulator [Pelosinus baikalensis]
MRLRMPCSDRIGLVRDISIILEERKINIVTIEVEQGAVFLECQGVLQKDAKELIEALERVADVHSVEITRFMPSKERVEQLDAVLTSVRDGILVVNCDGSIIQCNAAAARILKISSRTMIGQSIENSSWNALVAETLKTGCSYKDQEMFVECISSYCVISTVPLKDTNNEVIGVVTVLRDIGDVRELVKKMTASLPVDFGDITCDSMVMKELILQSRRYALSDSTVLIRGETGTGKELFARALHSGSARSQGTFVPINCAAIPETLMESELFGYEEGAFTGAVKGGKPGLFELSNGGTLFLDEIGEMSVHLQVKLLRVLQERRVRRLGSSREVAVDVRVITATNRNLEDMVVRGAFREDLYYRLNVIPLTIPPLRERPEDIGLLAEYFLQRFADKMRRPVNGFSKEALERLEQYNWPGNVRELENVIERAVNLVEGSKVRPEHICLGRIAATANPLSTIQFETYQSLKERLAEAERAILKETLRRYRSSRRVGSVLDLSHTAVLKKLRKYNLANE